MKKISTAIFTLLILAASIHEGCAQKMKEVIKCPDVNMVQRLIDKHLANLRNGIFTRHNLTGTLQQRANIPQLGKQLTLNSRALPNGVQCEYTYIIENRPQVFLELTITSR